MCVLCVKGEYFMRRDERDVASSLLLSLVILVSTTGLWTIYTVCWDFITHYFVTINSYNSICVCKANFWKWLDSLDTYSSFCRNWLFFQRRSIILFYYDDVIGVCMIHVVYSKICIEKYNLVTILLFLQNMLKDYNVYIITKKHLRFTKNTL